MSLSSAPAVRLWTVRLSTAEDLRRAYLVWVPQGGLFVPTPIEGLVLGESGMLLADLPDGGARLGVTGRVVWISPTHGRADRPEGIGVAFDKGNTDIQASAVAEAKDRIERCLGPGLLNDPRPTWTL